MQNCGCCWGFQKVEGNWGNSGLCEIQDHRTNADCGHNCRDFKRVRETRAEAGIPDALRPKAEIQEELAHE